LLETGDIQLLAWLLLADVSWRGGSGSAHFVDFTTA
jgi:hypothetical protein